MKTRQRYRKGRRNQN